MMAFAADFALLLKANDILLLKGNLGAGKTTFVRGLAKGLGSGDLVQSPTYVYLQIYEALLSIYHFDLYRISNERDFLSLGFEEFLSKGGISVIEWPERISAFPLKKAISIEFSFLSEEKRSLSIQRINL